MSRPATEEEQTEFKFYEVGGCLRDEILGIESNDVDFTVIGPSYAKLLKFLKAEGFKVFKESEEHLTIRAQVPDGHPLRLRTNVADFVLSRKEWGYLDGRRPEFVEMGTLEDDVARRDFTCNALVRDCETLEIIDLYDGVEDIKKKTLRFVGNGFDRIREDGLRVLRGWRFMICKGFHPHPHTWRALTSDVAKDALSKRDKLGKLAVSRERVREELEKMFRHDTEGTFKLLTKLEEYNGFMSVLFTDGLRMSATMKE